MTDNQMSGEGGQENLKPNVKPQYDQNVGSLDEATCKPEQCELPRRRSRSSDSERRGRRSKREHGHGAKRERGRSAESRRSSRRWTSDGRDATQHPGDYLDETECPVCFCTYDNVFKTPKLLSCGHTFCLECLARINVSSMNIKTLVCPVCRELTDIRHGRDLPQLGNNRDIFRKLPSSMQQAQAVKFERSKGKLVLKNQPLTNCLRKKTAILPVGVMEQGLAGTTVINVGRPPSRMRGRLGRMFQSNQCYYTVVASIIAIAVALIIVGILTFVVMPSMYGNRPPPGPNFNSSQPQEQH